MTSSWHKVLMGPKRYCRGAAGWRMSGRRQLGEGMSMRRLLSSLAAVSLLTVQQAQAELQCLPPQERAVVEVAALRSELMVLATGCHDDDGYNAFIRKFQADLMGNEKAIGEIFQHKYGRR